MPDIEIARAMYNNFSLPMGGWKISDGKLCLDSFLSNRAIGVVGAYYAVLNQFPEVPRCLIIRGYSALYNINLLEQVLEVAHGKVIFNRQDYEFSQPARISQILNYCLGREEITEVIIPHRWTDLIELNPEQDYGKVRVTQVELSLNPSAVPLVNPVEAEAAPAAEDANHVEEEPAAAAALAAVNANHIEGGIGNSNSLYSIRLQVLEAIYNRDINTLNEYVEEYHTLLNVLKQGFKYTLNFLGGKIINGYNAPADVLDKLIVFSRVERNEEGLKITDVLFQEGLDEFQEKFDDCQMLLGIVPEGS